VYLKIFGKVFISAGIDMSLALVAEFISYEHALLTAKQMEYQWQTL